MRDNQLFSVQINPNVRYFVIGLKLVEFQGLEIWISIFHLEGSQASVLCDLCSKIVDGGGLVQRHC